MKARSCGSEEHLHACIYHMTLSRLLLKFLHRNVTILEYLYGVIRYLVIIHICYSHLFAVQDKGTFQKFKIDFLLIFRGYG